MEGLKCPIAMPQNLAGEGYTIQNALTSFSHKCISSTQIMTEMPYLSKWRLRALEVGKFWLNCCHNLRATATHVSHQKSVNAVQGIVDRRGYPFALHKHGLLTSASECQSIKDQSNIEDTKGPATSVTSAATCLLKATRSQWRKCGT